MAFRQSFGLAGAEFLAFGRSGWWYWTSGLPAVDTDLTKNNAAAYLAAVRINFFTGLVSLQLSASADDASLGGAAGPDLSDDFEANGLVTFTGPAGSLTVRGIGDATEPYQWTPSNAGDFETTFGSRGITRATLSSIELSLVLAIDADPGAVSNTGPSASMSPEAADQPPPADAEPGTVIADAPSAALSAAPSEDPVDAAAGTVSTDEPLASLSASLTSAVPVNADPGTVTTAEPSALLTLRRHTATVNANPGTVATADPSAELSADVAGAAVAVELGPRALAPPRAVLAIEARGFWVDVAPGTVRGTPPTAEALAGVGSLAGVYGETIRAASPRYRVLTCAEIRHPDAITPVRLVNDIESRVIDGETYVRSRFEAQLADEVERRSPRAQLVVGNVGRALQQWVELVGGAGGGTVRVFEILDLAGVLPEWELTLDIASVATTSAHVVLTLGFDPLLGRPSVALRFDPQTAPGLF